MRKTLLAFAATAALGSAAQGALAHGSMKPQHGGIVQMSGETLFELVVKPTSVAVYVSEDDEPVNAAGMTGNLKVTAEGKSQTVALKPGPGNQFEATGIKVPPGARVAVQMTNKTTQARTGTTFTLK